MKAELFIQYILSVLVLLLSLVMILAAFAKDAQTIWKFFCSLLVLFSIGLIREIRQELKQFKNDVLKYTKDLEGFSDGN